MLLKIRPVENVQWFTWIKWKSIKKEVQMYMCQETLVRDWDSAPFTLSRVERWISKWVASKPSKLWVNREKGRKCCLLFLIFYCFEKVEYPPKASGVPGEMGRKTHHQNKNLQPQVLVLGTAWCLLPHTSSCRKHPLSGPLSKVWVS